MAHKSKKPAIQIPFIRKRIQRSLNTIKAYLKQGMSESKLSLAILIGLFLGISPMIGLTTAVAAIAATLLRLNMIVIQTIQYTLAPLQFIFFIPFMRASTYITGNQQTQSLSSIQEMFKQDWLIAIQNISSLYFTSIILWAFISTPLILLLNKRVIILLSKVKQNQPTA